VDDVELDLRNMGVKRWRPSALDRTEWASVTREAKEEKEEGICTMRIMCRIGSLNTVISNL
jgi:hypothetical protein